jgi:sulfite exporter TauE/SafE
MTMNEPLTLLSALILGLMGGVHCIGMCGGISGALGLTDGSRQPQKLLAYNLGRVFSYTLMGSFAGLAAGLLQDQWQVFGRVMRVSANLLLILMGLYLANWWMGLTRLEQLGNRLWKKVQPLGRHLLPVEHSGQAFGLGMLWGWLPCGLIYSALLWTATAGSAYQSGLLMLAFGLGTLPAMLATGIFAQQLRQQLQHKGVRVTAGLLIITFGVYSMAMMVQHRNHNNTSTPAQHQHH